MDESILKKFFEVSQHLGEALKSGVALNEFERLSLENHLSWVELALLEWKRQNRVSLRTAATESDARGNFPSSRAA